MLIAALRNAACLKAKPINDLGRIKQINPSIASRLDWKIVNEKDDAYKQRTNQDFRR